MLTNASRTVSINSRTDAEQASKSTPAQNRTESASYTAPALVALGSLDVVQAGNGYYYDGPHTTYLRF